MTGPRESRRLARAVAVAVAVLLVPLAACLPSGSPPCPSAGGQPGGGQPGGAQPGGGQFGGGQTDGGQSGGGQAGGGQAGGGQSGGGQPGGGQPGAGRPGGGPVPTFSVRQADGGCPPPPPCPDCPGGHGEPHLVTIAQHRFDFQAAGEFVALRSSTGDFEVQWRQEPVRDTATAGITAVAALVGGSRITFGSDATSVRVDGEILELTEGDPVALSSGTVVLRRGGSVSAFDRTQDAGLHVDPHAVASGVVIDPPGEAHQSFTGLLATDATADDLTTQVARRRLAAASRVTSGDSLFDYEKGAGPDTYWDPTFPERLPDSPSSAALRRARRTCAAAGVRDQALLDECAYDVATTGDGEYADLAAQLDAVRNGDGADTTSTPAPPDGPIRWVTDLTDVGDPHQPTSDGIGHVLVPVDGIGPDAPASLIALDAGTGAEVWRLEGIAAGCGVVAGNGRLFAAADARGELAAPGGGSAVVAIDPQSGRVLGTRYEPDGSGTVTTLAPCDGALQFFDGTVVYASGRQVVGLDAGDLSLRWNLRLDGGIRSAPVLAAGALWVGWGDPLTVGVIDMDDGNLLSSGRIDGLRALSLDAAALVGGNRPGLVLAGQTVDGDALVRVDVDDGRVVESWRTLLETGERTPAVLASDGTVVAGYVDTALVGVFGAADGRRQITIRSSGPQRSGDHLVLDADGNVYLSTLVGPSVESFDPAGGLRWRFDAADIDLDNGQGDLRFIGPLVDDIVVALGTIDGEIIVVGRNLG